jgi:hypothetical protein
MCTSVVYAATTPSAPTTLTPGLTTTYDPLNRAPQYVDAYAGNITALEIIALGQTKAWQGYYGNITGTITLDDVNNFTFYNWTSIEPQGQIYATLNDSISWLAVDCYDYANTDMDWNEIETYYNIEVDDVDGVNETFNETTHPNFQVGSVTMTGCPTTWIYQNDTRQSDNFVNVLLWDMSNNDTGWIYTTTIENKTSGSLINDLTCYNGEECDFQILVNEDGHGTDTNPTVYYFWVELL